MNAQVSRAVWNQVASRLASDTATLAPAANANLVKLVAAPFTPGLDLDVGSLTLATFTGSAPLAVGLGTQDVFLDPSTGNRVIILTEPVGGWTWICTVAPSPAETIYGWVVTDQAGTLLLGSGLLPAPVTIDAVEEAVLIDQITIAFPQSSPLPS